MTAPPLDLRAVVADVVRDLVAQMTADTVREQPGTTTSGSAGSASPAPDFPAPPGTSGRITPPAQVTPAEPRTRVQQVRIGDDADLDGFARQLLTLFENPKNRQDLRAGRLRFRLDPPAATGAAAADGPALRVETGAVTERQVKAAHEAGRRIILGRRAVLTPLGREKAGALGVSIQKEQ